MTFFFGRIIEIFVLNGPDKRVRNLMPFVVRQPMLIGAFFMWLCSCGGLRYRLSDSILTLIYNKMECFNGVS